MLQEVLSASARIFSSASGMRPGSSLEPCEREKNLLWMSVLIDQERSLSLSFIPSSRRIYFWATRTKDTYLHSVSFPASDRTEGEHSGIETLAKRSDHCIHFRYENLSRFRLLAVACIESVRLQSAAETNGNFLFGNFLLQLTHWAGGMEALREERQFNQIRRRSSRRLPTWIS